jgi:crotonobetainyl-CoA:carnitine CoA-transferase CaiB-like acyl-CoA transferase
MPGALEGIRVIDFGQYIAGPLAAVMLADQGADVIHVDPPGGPVRKHPSEAFFNRGKRRISLDLKTPDGLSTAQRLIDSADVVIENFRPGVMDRLGLGVEAMTRRNPSLIYCTLPGFGKSDPRAGLRAWEGVLDAATENCFPRTGEPPPEWDMTRPTYSAVTLASNFGGFLGATGIVMALIARHRTGKGQHVDVPLYDAMFTLIGHSGAYVNSRGLHPPNPIHGRGAGCFRCGDGKYVQFDTSSSRHLTWFAREAGLNGIWENALLDLEKNRAPDVNQRLHTKLRELFLTKSAAEWEEIGNRSGAAIGWARNVNEWIHTPHAQALGAVTQLNDPELGPTWMAGLPVRLTETPGSPQGPRHLPDADRASALSELDGLAPKAAPDGAEPDLAHPLQGMRVIDLCLALAGPTCGRLLLEFGAEVIKIQKPHAGVGGYLNRGKRSLLLDLEPPEAQQVFWKLAEGADVVLENFSPGTADRLGIGYDEVKARNPDVVYTSISCYGQVGPWRGGRGWERQGQAVAGIMERTGVIPAILGPYNLIDIGTGVMGTFATALGLFHRLRSGQGQHVQASLCQTATYQQAPYMLDYKGHVADEPRGYEAFGTGPLNRFYPAGDRWFFLAAHLPEEKTALASVEGLGGLRAESPNLEATLESRFLSESAAIWVERLRKAGIAAHEVTPVGETMTDAIVQAQGLSVSQEVEGVGMATMPGLSVHLSRTPMRLGDRCHVPGSDGPAILQEIGMSDKLESLERRWMLQTRDLPSAWGGG